MGRTLSFFFSIFLLVRHPLEVETFRNNNKPQVPASLATRVNVFQPKKRSVSIGIFLRLVSNAQLPRPLTLYFNFIAHPSHCTALSFSWKLISSRR